MNTNLQSKGIIEQWQVCYDNEMLCKEDRHFHIVGIVKGKLVNTSRIKRIDGRYVITKNSVYELGIPFKSLRKSEYELLQSLIEEGEK